MGKLWQRNYHEHLINDEKSYQRIAKSIINNPQIWKDDSVGAPLAGAQIAVPKKFSINLTTIPSDRSLPGLFLPAQ